MASTFMFKSGCYDNVYKFSSIIQVVITKRVVGGRAMCNSNKQYHVKKKITDFYACSLYPSAMYYMDGFLEGTPNLLNDNSYEFLKTHTMVILLELTILN